MAAGHAPSSLSQKLGIKETSTICFLNTPKNYSVLLGGLSKDVKIAKTLRDNLDFIHFFTKNKQELTERFPTLKAALDKSGELWVSWPKGSSGVITDLKENVVREIGLTNGLVNVKVVAIDDVWSGLKFVYRIKDRM